jgi:hypothetical protein
MGKLGAWRAERDNTSCCRCGREQLSGRKEIQQPRHSNLDKLNFQGQKTRTGRSTRICRRSERLPAELSPVVGKNVIG